MTRWDKIGTTDGPTRIGNTVVPAGAELFIPIAEPGDTEDCPSCKLIRAGQLYPPVNEAELFRLHLERHLLPQVHYAVPKEP